MQMAFICTERDTGAGRKYVPLEIIQKAITA